MNLLRATRRTLAAVVLIGGGSVAIATSTSGAAAPPAHAATATHLRNAAVAPIGCSEQPPATGEHCLPLASTVTGTSDNSGGRCTAIVVLQVTLNPNVVSYEATWVPAGQSTAIYHFYGSGTTQGATSSTSQWSTSQIAYGDLTYNVPKGDGAWFLGQGSAPAPCTSPGPGSTQAWGWTSHAVVRGHVTFKGTGGPAPNITVSANCASGGTTTTDSYGAYGFVLSPGSCTIKPTVPKGEVSSPVQRVVQVASQDITNVDFTVPGGPLKIFLKQLEPLRSGLAIHGVHYREYPADFVTREDGAYRCESGCTDITVSVIDSATGKAPAPHAIVDVTLGPIDVGTQTFDGQSISRSLGVSEICSLSTNGHGKDCGSSLRGLETNAEGQVHIRYWAPAVLATSALTLSFTASCDVRPCQASEAMADLPLTVKPYEIYQNTSTISTSDVAELSEWSDGATSFSHYLEDASNEVTGFKYLFKVLKRFQAATKLAGEGLEAIEHVEPLAWVVDVGLKINEFFEQNAMMAMFLDDSGLSAFGVGRSPTEASATGTPSFTFQNELINPLPVPDFFKIGGLGFWWASAEYIETILNAYGAGQATGWTLGTAVYEVSHCSDPSNDGCEPGYRSEVGNSASDRTGIQPELVMELTLSHNGGAPVEATAFDIGYDAFAWTTTQPDLEGVMKDR